MTGHEPQGTMGRVQTEGLATSRPLSPSRLPLRAHFHQKRDVWVRGRLEHSPVSDLINLNVDLFMYLILKGLGLVHEKFDVCTGL